MRTTTYNRHEYTLIKMFIHDYYTTCTINVVTAGKLTLKTRNRQCWSKPGSQYCPYVKSVTITVIVNHSHSIVTTCTTHNKYKRQTSTPSRRIRTRDQRSRAAVDLRTHGYWNRPRETTYVSDH